MSVNGSQAERPFPFDSALSATLVSGIIAALLDGLAAIAMYLSADGEDPLRIFIYIASGLFGNDAFEGGTDMIIAGLTFHFLIAISFSWIYHLLFPILKLQTTRWMLSGLLYGILVWCIMNLIVLPLSNVPHPINYKAWAMTKGIIVLMVMVGLPIAYMQHRYYSYLRSPTRS